MDDDDVADIFRQALAGGENLAWFDEHVWYLALAPFAWQTLTSLYILLGTKDDKRSVGPCD